MCGSSLSLTPLFKVVSDPVSNEYRSGHTHKVSEGRANKFLKTLLKDLIGQIGQ
jgi:hypothetical protein